jgi:hypothetical protein
MQGGIFSPLVGFSLLRSALTSHSGFYSMHEYIQGIRKHFARCPGRAGGVNHYFHDRKQCPGG